MLQVALLPQLATQFAMAAAHKASRINFTYVLQSLSYLGYGTCLDPSHLLLLCSNLQHKCKQHVVLRMPHIVSQRLQAADFSMHRRLQQLHVMFIPASVSSSAAQTMHNIAIAKGSTCTQWVRYRAKAYNILSEPASFTAIWYATSVMGPGLLKPGVLCSRRC
jgi:hypothetical protein